MPAVSEVFQQVIVLSVSNLPLASSSCSPPVASSSCSPPVASSSCSPPDGLVFLLIFGYGVLFPKAARSMEVHLSEGVFVVGHIWTESCVVLPPAVGTLRTNRPGRMGMTLLQFKVVEEIINTHLFLRLLRGQPNSIPFGFLLLILQLSGPLSGRTQAVSGQPPSLVTVDVLSPCIFLILQLSALY